MGHLFVRYAKNDFSQDQIMLNTVKLHTFSHK